MFHKMEPRTQDMPEVNFHFLLLTRKRKKGEINVWTVPAELQRQGEDLGVGFYSNMKVSLTFSAPYWLLILVTLLQTADGKAQPADIYKLIWLREMAFCKKRHR